MTTPKIRDYFKAEPIRALLLYVIFVLLLIVLLASFGNSAWFGLFIIPLFYFYFKVSYPFLMNLNKLDELTKVETGYYRKDGTPLYRYTNISFLAMLLIVLAAMLSGPFIAVLIGVTL